MRPTGVEAGARYHSSCEVHNRPGRPGRSNPDGGDHHARNVVIPVLRTAMIRTVTIDKPCRTGRARFRSPTAAAAVVGTLLVEPGDPATVVVPRGVERTACPSCRGWHVTTPWSPWARSGTRAARLRDSVTPWPLTAS